MKERLLNTIQRILTAVVLGLSACLAQAGTVHVALSATFTMPLLADGSVPLSLQFDVPDPAGSSVLPGPGSIQLSDVAISGSFNGAAFSSTSNFAGWFSYDFPSGPYRGVDIKLRNFLVADDMLQLILLTPDALFSGPANAPTWTLGSWAGLGGGSAYYLTGGGTTSATALGDLSRGSYSATVPEPGTAALLPLALLGLVFTRSRRPAACVINR
jgi:hypothetical protein